ncbi:MAG: LacI family transcriptional regulator [Desulfotomaculum sp.]|nr:LacI family transcriptional regulator [Desulfotomaculum sp.]MCL0081166.1 LacI family transcriptional regulator [Peptococcaceae bacterium]
MVTIVDIAKKAGVSKSTVSRVLSGKGSCKQVTKDKVLVTAKELNYRPNRLAQAMITKKTGIIGLIIYRKHMPVIAHPFYGPILDVIATETKKADYSLLMMADNEVGFCPSDCFFQYRVDGLILLSRVPAELVGEIQQAGRPFVLINNTAIIEDANYIVNDDYLGAYDATMYLLNKGYRKIAYISGPLEHRSYRLRWQGFQDALTYKGHEIQPHHHYIGDLGLETGMAGVYHFLQKDSRPDAIFASNDMMAIGALKILHSLQINVPEDLAVMGFDDIEFAKWMTPALTTVRVDKKAMGRVAVKKLLDILNGKTVKNDRVVLAPKIIFRQST